MTTFTSTAFGSSTDAKMGYQVSITANTDTKQAVNSKGRRIPRMLSRVFHKTSGAPTQRAAAKSGRTEKADRSDGRKVALAHSKADAAMEDRKDRLRLFRKDSGYTETEEEDEPVCRSAYVPRHAGMDALYLSIPQGHSRSESVASGDYLWSLAEDARRRRATKHYVEEEEEEEESMAVSEDPVSAAAWEAKYEEEETPTNDTAQPGYFDAEASGKMSSHCGWEWNGMLAENIEEQADVLNRMSLAHKTPIRAGRRSGHHQRSRSSVSAASTAATTNRHLSSLSASTKTTATTYSEYESELFTGSSKGSSFGPLSLEENGSLSSRRAGGLRPGEKIGRKVANYVRPPMPGRHEAPQQAGVSKTAICLYDSDY